MQSPTFIQHQLLESIKENGGSIIVTEDEKLDIHWELVRAGYLKNFVRLPTGWRFSVTEKTEEYFNSLKQLST